MYFPRTDPAPVASEHLQGRLPLPAGSFRVLLVEDDTAVGELTRRVLEREGHQVILAHDGIEGREKALANRDIDVIVSDLVMPRMNGPEMMHALRASGVAVPVLFMSGYTARALNQFDLDLGNAKFIEKPFSISDLIAAIATLLADPK
jgi:DNA-binding response OmpR family regulator